ncbi:MAG: heme exporter protein CcmD [Pseudomonadota bacterium]
MFDFKYAEFIVPSFAVTAVVFAAMLAFSLNHARRWKRRYEELTSGGSDEA